MLKSMQANRDDYCTFCNLPFHLCFHVLMLCSNSTHHHAFSVYFLTCEICHSNDVVHLTTAHGNTYPNFIMSLMNKAHAFCINETEKVWDQILSVMSLSTGRADTALTPDGSNEGSLRKRDSFHTS